MDHRRLHDVTDRTFTIRRALRLNDALPTDPVPHWIWQPGPWLLVDRITGHITALHLPDFDPAVSDAVWFRDYAAYCGTATTAKGGLFAVVAQLGARRAVVQSPSAHGPSPTTSSLSANPPNGNAFPYASPSSPPAENPPPTTSSAPPPSSKRAKTPTKTSPHSTLHYPENPGNFDLASTSIHQHYAKILRCLAALLRRSCQEC